MVYCSCSIVVVLLYIVFLHCKIGGSTFQDGIVGRLFLTLRFQGGGRAWLLGGGFWYVDPCASLFFCALSLSFETSTCNILFIYITSVQVSRVWLRLMFNEPMIGSA